MRYNSIIVTIKDDLASIELNRPEKHNAINSQMIAELNGACDHLADVHGLRGCVLTGRGVSFCAGGDLEWMRSQFNADRASRKQSAYQLAAMLQKLNTAPFPLLCCVNGNAFGGGVGLMAIGDYVVAHNKAKIGLTEVRLGMIPATISPYIVAKLGEFSARRLFMSGEVMDAQAAASYSLVDVVADAASMERHVADFFKPFQHSVWQAVADAKALARRWGQRIDTQIVEETACILADYWENPHTQKGINAFLEKKRDSEAT